MRIVIIFLGVFTAGTFAWGQDSAKEDFPSQHIDPVYLTDYKLKDFSVGQTLHELSDSLLLQNPPNLTALLQYHTPIYFKENGLGMVSSPSFRGTTASQTAVLWNGININSTFLGQTDFNTINTGGYDHIAVRAGGGSLAYGTGAIGGTVHLNTQLLFGEDTTSNRLFLGYGSFNTLDARYRLNVSSENWIFRFSLSHNQSDNDYKLQQREGRNTNGQFKHTAVNLGVGYKIDTANELRLYSEWYDGNRHFPIFYTSEIKTKYLDKDWRNLLEWKSVWAGFTSRLKAAFIKEKYRYYENVEKENYSYGDSDNYIVKYDLSYKINKAIRLDALMDYEHTQGTGSDIETDKRTIGGTGFLWKHQLNERLKYQAGLRKEFTNAYGSPLLYSLGIEYEVSPFYQAKLSASKNFRRPTFNDLYWAGSGNPDLKAEKSDQIELGNRFAYREFQFHVTGYFNNIKDMIHWLPEANGLFYPRNEDHVKTYGLETLMEWKTQWNDQHHLSVQGTYAYTISKDQYSRKQLIYVPHHKGTFSMTYVRKKISLDYQFLYNGSVYMRTDNDPKHVLGGYGISNIGLAYKPFKSNAHEVGARVRNIFDKRYENVKRYELPGINFNVFVTVTL